jgi:hypothetical protein
MQQGAEFRNPFAAARRRVRLADLLRRAALSHDMRNNMTPADLTAITRQLESMATEANAIATKYRTNHALHRAATCCRDFASSISHALSKLPSVAP